MYVNATYAAGMQKKKKYMVIQVTTWAKQLFKNAAGVQSSVGKNQRICGISIKVLSWVII